MKAPDGRTYFVSPENKTSWTRPGASAAAEASVSVKKAPAAEAPLPAGWREMKAPDGRPYYISPENKTSWTRPS